MTTQYRMGDEGHALRYHLVDQDGADVDIGDATTLEVVFRRPDGTKFARTASLVGSGADGRFEYVLAAGDLDVHGIWYREGHVETPILSVTTRRDRFLVIERL